MSTTNQLDKATDIGLTLAEVATGYCRRQRRADQFCQDAADPLQGDRTPPITDATAASDAKRAEEAKAALAADKALLGEVCTKLADRQVSVQAMVFMADTLAYAGLPTRPATSTARSSTGRTRTRSSPRLPPPP